MPVLRLTEGLTKDGLLFRLGPMDFSANSIIWILFIGLVIGAVAKLLMPGRDPGGCIITMLIGIAGAFVASYLGEKLNIYPVSGIGRFVAAVIGAMLLLLLYRLIAGRRS